MHATVRLMDELPKSDQQAPGFRAMRATAGAALDLEQEMTCVREAEWRAVGGKVNAQVGQSPREGAE